MTEEMKPEKQERRAGLPEDTKQRAIEASSIRDTLLELYEQQASGARDATEVAREASRIAGEIAEKNLAELVLTPDLPEEQAGKINAVFQLAVNAKAFANVQPRIYRPKNIDGQ